MAEAAGYGGYTLIEFLKSNMTQNKEKFPGG
jgi:hypothetical protein